MTLAERQRVASTKLNYPPGTRLELIEMGDDPRPVASGTRGTVKVVDDISGPYADEKPLFPLSYNSDHNR